MTDKQQYSRLILHQSKASAVRRFHPWVFSGAVKAREGNPQQGDVVEVMSEKGEFLGIGHFGTGSVSARLFSFEKAATLEEIWKARFESAYALRRGIGLTDSPQTNAYRLVNAEGDEMPGLIVDWYNGTAVVQCHSKGMHREREKFAAILKEIYGDRLQAVYDKSGATLSHKFEIRNPKSEIENPKSEIINQKSSDAYLFGTSSQSEILENGHRFRVNWEEGQKTGFFLDQRDNRQLLSQYAKGRKVLNTFCYSGGFSVYALKAGATLVHSVDSSAKAIEWTKENVHLNNLANAPHEAFAEDVFDFMKLSKEDYDLIVLDPPAFAKGQSARHNAIQAYTRLNAAALRKIKRGGVVFTFSCSQVVTPEMFTGAVTSAAIESRRKVKVLHHLTQPADHPVSIFNPEGLYLKGLVLYVE